MKARARSILAIVAPLVGCGAHPQLDGDAAIARTDAAGGDGRVDDGTAPLDAPAEEGGDAMRAELPDGPVEAALDALSDVDADFAATVCAIGPPASACPISSCGNDRIDTCSFAPPDATLLPTTATEECDGVDLGGATCVTLGYVGGALACSATCSLDDRGCETCVAGGRTSCADPDLRGVGLFLLAATDTEIGLLWTDGCAPTSGYFTRLRPDFTIASDGGARGAPLSLPSLAAVPTPNQTSMAPSSNGWLIAIGTSNGISMVSLDASGTEAGSRDVSFSQPYAGSEVNLVARAGGDPLLMWVDGYHPGTLPSSGTLHAELLASDGSARAPDATFMNASVLGTAGVFVDDGFELAMVDRTSGPGTPGSIQLVHVGLDASVRMDAAIALDGPVTLEQTPLGLTWSGSGIGLLYTFVVDGGAWTIMFQQVTPGGALNGAPVQVVGWPGGYTPGYSTWYPPIGAGTDAVILDAQGKSADVLRLSTSGNDVWPPVPVVRASGIQSIAMTGQGSDAVVAWSARRDQSLHMARISLTP